MIKKQNDLFILETKSTSYLFRIMPSGHLEHLHYGEKVQLGGTNEALYEKYRFNAGNLITYSEGDASLGLEDRCLELSSLGKGDIREPFIEALYSDGSSTCDFLYESYSIEEEKVRLETLPSSYDETGSAKTLVITLSDARKEMKLLLYYSVFEESDVIVRSVKVINSGEQAIKIKRLMSMQLDFDDNEYIFTNFGGAWAREMKRYDHVPHQGKFVNSSLTGTSSSRQNPFVMLSEPRATEMSGACYGFNLVYSGNHYEALEVGSFGKMRLVSGINPQNFGFTLTSGERLESPEAIMSFSSKGFTGMSHQMHHFVREHIVRGEWKRKERPVLLNSWEAAYFNFDEGKLVKMAKAAKEVGIELFVMDDGWFGERNDDTTSLGDWEVNEKKLPKGLKGLGEKINDLGMDFGIWVEPEMVSVKSKCYALHPEWAVKTPQGEQSLGRNQMILDLTQEEVQTYIIDAMTKVFGSAPISYVKWDMNRIFSDTYSLGLEKSRQEEFSHRYVMGLYKVLETLTMRFPHILFEGCAAGGNRFDLGMLCYMPQIWASDNTDAICRAEIQTGYSYGYPMSVIGAHVSGCPNHQTLRTVPIETRFNVAAFGLLGYECHISELSKEEQNAVKEQITLYKQYRQLLQFGTYYRLKNGGDTDYTKGVYQWLTVAPDQSCAVGAFLQTQVVPNMFAGKFKTRGLAEDKLYHFTNRALKYNVKAFGDLINTVSPIRIKQDSLMHQVIAKVVKMDGETEDYSVTGSMLNHVGVKLKQGFAGTGYDEEIRFFQDYGSRLYFMHEIDIKNNQDM